MKQIFISDERDSAAPAIIVAQKGRLAADSNSMKLLLRLEDGTIHRQPRGNGDDESTYQVLQFSSYDVNLDLEKPTSANKKRRRKNKELSLPELNQAIASSAGEARQDLLAELHTRMALPIAPLVFALLGVPLGIQPHRSGRGGSFALALGVFLCYYLLLSFGDTLVADAGWPAAALWLPNLAFLLAGLYLLRRTAIEKPITLMARVNNVLFGAMRRLFRSGGHS
jgi:lipopolysaccharide export system permease protein